ncbi:MAG TPA: hypothetical protein VMZ33_02885 [Candidatus Limnocylindrales bacterium]|nr:hypothetical protein [Candidatus Limnocylindrales bacterium]
MLSHLDRPGRAAAVVALAAILASAIGVSAGEGPPANDGFDQAANVPPSALPYSTTTSSLSATNEGGEPVTKCGATTSSIWFRFVPSSTGVYRVDTTGSNYDTQVDVFRGTALNNLMLVDCNDDIDATNPDLRVSRLAFRGVAGQQLYFRVAASGPSGFTVVLALRKVIAPGNDSYGQATTISSLPYDTNANNTNATIQTGEPGASTPCQTQGATRWYRYTPQVDEVIWAHTSGTPDFDTVLGVYTGGTVGAAALVLCNDNQYLSGEMVNASGVTFRAKANVTYRFQVGGLRGQSGDYSELQFHVRRLASVEHNDAFANAMPINGFQFSDPVTLRKSTLQPDEPNCYGSNSVWYKFTPNSGANLQVATSDTFNSRVGVFESTGPGITNLQMKLCGSTGSYPFEAGKTYYIVVVGEGSRAPAVTFQMEPAT